MTDYLCKMNGQYASGDAWSIGLHVTSNQTASALLTTWSNAWIAAWTNGTYGLQALYNTTTTTESFSVATLNARMAETQKVFLPSVNPGTSSDTALPERDAIVVSFRSPYIQRFGRGRIYLPAPVEGIVDAAFYTSASMTRVKTAVTAVKTAINADGSTLFVTNMKPLKDGTPAFQKTVLTSILVARKPATQSRRTDPDAPTYV